MSIKLIKRLKPLISTKKKAIFFADFETTLFNNKHYVTCFAIISEDLIHSSNSIISYDLSSNLKLESQKLGVEFIQNCLKLTKENQGKEVIIYFHNLGKFDGLFLINFINLFSDLELKVITRENIIYEIKVISKNFSFKFRDSYLLLPLSLDKIASLFDDTKINFTELAAPYERYSDETFKANLLKYCTHDVQILQKSLSWYSNYIQIKYNIEMYNSLTLSALAFKIFRTYFYSDASIYQSHSFMDTFIRKSYKGGVADVYKPYLENGYYYDVNSLYPYIMSIYDMPIGPGVYEKIEFSNLFNLEDFFGFIQVKVKAPSNLYIPFLTVNDKTHGLISPIGEWTDVYFSEEIKYAITLGYKFEYYSYYKFDRKNIFSDYVTKIYNDRIQNKENPALNTISKLLLNSLYGRFGMSNSVYKNLFLRNTKKDKELLKKVSLIYDSKIINIFPGLSKKENITLIRYNEVPDVEHVINLYKRGVLSTKVYNSLMQEPSKKFGDLNVSVHIASAITAYSRIYMHKLKDQYKDNLYYSDTDSIIVDNPISNDLISNDKIGLLKLEYKIKKGIFIAPKLYYLELEDNVIIKSKGITSKLLTYDDFINLYNESSINIKIVNNFTRNLKDYTINTSEQNIEIRGILNKRDKVFDSKGNWKDTKPLSYNKLD